MDIEAGLDLLKRDKKMRVLINEFGRPDFNLRQDYFKSFRNAFYELAEQNQLPMIPFLLKDVGNVPALNLPDGIHPNPEGHHIISRTVLEHLEPLLLN